MQRTDDAEHPSAPSAGAVDCETESPEPSQKLLTPAEPHVATLVEQLLDLSAQMKITLAAVLLFSGSCTLILSRIMSVSLAAGSKETKLIFPFGALTAIQRVMFSFCISAITLCGLDYVNMIPCDKATRKHIKSSAELSLYLLFMFLCDRTALVERRKKTLDSDFFTFLIIGLFVAGLCTITRAPAHAPAQPQVTGRQAGGATIDAVAASATVVPTVFHVPHLNRDQTEEWKGWMQVVFLWYHYFDNKLIYNAIRLFIAAYVWMTGFGNFSYYYIRQDFSFTRFCQMQWRLNFFVLCVCLILRNEYMLYYICPLHTLFTMIIFFGLKMRHQMNRTNLGVLVKFSGLFVLSVVVWDLPFSKHLFDQIWFPFKWLVRYDDPYNPERDVLSEWFFRSKLDHLIWIVGMVNAYTHPTVEAFLIRLDSRPPMTGACIKAVITLAVLAVFLVYYKSVYTLRKVEYNRLHPYTSFVPLLVYLTLRNLFTRARMYHLHLFEFLGKITLETYITQFHIWMGTTGLNGSPKQLLKILPGEYPMCDFALASVVTLVVSFRLFHTSNEMRTIVIPSKANTAVILKNAAFIGAFSVGLYLIFLIL